MQKKQLFKEEFCQFNHKHVSNIKKCPQNMQKLAKLCFKNVLLAVSFIPDPYGWREDQTLSSRLPGNRLKVLTFARDV